MVRNSRWNDPLVASLLAWAVPGLGHLYLRRWLRAAGWLLAVSVVAALFGLDQPVDLLAVGTFDTLVSLLPLSVVLGASILDAHRVATAMRAGTTTRDRGTAELPDRLVVCQSCGRGVDAQLDFCHWCTTEFDVADATDATDDADPDLPRPASN